MLACVLLCLNLTTFTTSLDLYDNMALSCLLTISFMADWLRYHAGLRRLGCVQALNCTASRHAVSSLISMRSLSGQQECCFIGLQNTTEDLPVNKICSFNINIHQHTAVNYKQAHNPSTLWNIICSIMLIKTCKHQGRCSNIAAVNLQIWNIIPQRMIFPNVKFHCLLITGTYRNMQHNLAFDYASLFPAATVLRCLQNI